MEADVLWKRQRNIDLNRISQRSQRGRSVSMSGLWNAENANVHPILGIQMRGLKKN